MKIRAAVLEDFGQPLVVSELDLAEPKAGEVLVRLAACGVCHTDLYTASGADPTGYVPCVLGHEGAGVVESVGPDVALVGPGDHVITLFAPECGRCVHCRSGRTNRCVAIRDQQGLGFLPDGTTRLSRDGEAMRHFMGTSTFAEYTVMPEICWPHHRSPITTPPTASKARWRRRSCSVCSEPTESRLQCAASHCPPARHATTPPR